MKYLFAIAAFVLGTVGAFAQSELSQVKGGDKLVYKYVVYGERGREIFEDKTSELPATFVVTEKGYAIRYKAGRVEQYDERHTLQSVFSRGTLYPYSPEEQFRWMPKDLTVGKKEETSYLVPSKECSGVKNTFPDVSVQEGERKLIVQGVERTIQVLVLTYKGKWSGSGSCGSGRFETTVVFSKELNLVLEKKSLNFLPTGFLYAGEARIVLSIN